MENCPMGVQNSERIKALENWQKRHVPAEMLGAPVVKSARSNRRDGPMLSEIILNKQKHMQ